MESSKQYDSHDEESSQHSSYPINSWHIVKDNCETTENNSRKRKIESDISENDSLSDKTVGVLKRDNNNSTRLSADHETSDLYGLKKEFIESLGIRLPLAQWVYVLNFRCDKNDLKEVFGLAGNVVICSVVAIRARYANIMYSHPLEAVQAISMFNGQTLYGMKLKVTMINPPDDTFILPKGLKDIGPGLGFNGRPLRDIVKHYKKYTKYQVSHLDAALFCRENCNDEDEKIFDSKSIDLDVKSKDSEEITDASNRRKSFKITNVDDLYGKDNSQDTNVSEIQSKKPRCDEAEDESSSDGETDPRIVSSLSARLKTNNKSQSNVTLNAPISGSTIPTIGAELKPRAPYNNHEPQNYQPLNSQPANFQFRPNQPLGNTGSSGLGPPRPMGPSGPVPPFCPPVPAITPGPNVPIIGPVGPNSPMMGPVGPNGPMMGPVGPNGPMMRPVGPNGPMPPLGPMMGPVGPNGPFGPAAGPTTRTMGPVGPSGPFRPAGPNVTPVMQGPNPGPHPPGNDNVITLQFRNLPPTTTFPLLSDKVSQCGQVLSLQLTTPGCAVAKFAHRLHAERCFQFFNGKFIDGCVIEVRFA